MEWIEQELKELADTKTAYRTFNARIVATADPETMLGVRVPALRRLAKKIVRSEDRNAFLDELPHTYYEEYLLHAFVLNEERDPEAATEELRRLLPFADNWAVSDALAPKSFRKLTPERLEELSREFMAERHEYTRRFGISLLMHYLLPEHFRPEHLMWAKEADDGRYYVEMMVGWYVAEALVTQEETVLPFIEAKVLPEKTERIAIQKALDSRRISPELKEHLRQIRATL
ncbi:MAG: DNA alkylation repair protein [Atopobiaceae bacterium]|jgi:3-methyladenine DNA glycosylase AlkD|nr:DNA alkylation repair protein [Atopobiaceae bacterium]